MLESIRLPFHPSRRRRAGTVRFVDLHRGQAIALDAKPGDTLQVLHGAIWLTEPGRADDVFAGGGERVRMTHGGRVVIEALEVVRAVVPSSQVPSPQVPSSQPVRTVTSRARNVAAFAQPAEAAQ